jgi:hypothetical protein
MMKLAFHQEVSNLIVESYWEINEIVRDHFEAREQWMGVFVEGRFVLRPMRYNDLQDFLKNSYNSRRIVLQSQNSVVQLTRRLIQTISTGVTNVVRIIWS